jgi:apolipoprotein D and lipocalin family protein
MKTLGIRNFNLKIIIMLNLITLSSCKTQGLPVVNQVDIHKYAGTWYEIARLPNSFEKGLENVSATYSLKENGKIKVLNKGQKVSGKINQIEGVAWIPNPDCQGKLKVRFFWPFAGKYWILSLDKDYNYVLVGEPSRKYLWILSKTKTLDEHIYNNLLQQAKQYGFDIDKLVKIKQF